MGNKLARRASRLAGRAEYSTRQALARLTTSKDGNWRIDVDRGVSPPTMLQFVLRKQKGTDGRHFFPVPVVHLRNELPKDERGRTPHLTGQFFKAVANTGWVTFGEKHFFPMKSLRLLKDTFPTAVDGAAYAKSLGAPVIGRGLFELEDGDITFKDILSSSVEGKSILADTDGSGRIHPRHSIFKEFGGACTIQFRLWNPESGVFAKGILVPDERVVDKDGNPTIWLDWRQIKGNWKSLAKKRRGINTGAVNRDGVVVDATKLQEKVTGKGFILGILQKWDRNARYRWSYEILEKIQDNEKNRGFVLEFLSETLKELEEKGGLDSLFLEQAKDSPRLRLLANLCMKLGISPMDVPYARNITEESLGRFLFLLRQGAGKRSMRYVCVLDAGVPKGHCVIANPLGGEEKKIFRHGTLLAMTRFPIVLPQALVTLEVIDPKKEGWGHLSHLLIDGPKGKVVPQWTIFMNPKDLVLKMQGDDDGDILLVDDDPRVISMWEDRLPILEGNPNLNFKIENKGLPGGKGAIPIVKEDGSVSEEALSILGGDGRGPVGQLTFWISTFMSLGMGMHTLATAACVQDAIDQAKHNLPLHDPRKLISMSNWEEKSPGVWSPKPGCFLSSGSSWIGEDGHLDTRSFFRWASRETGQCNPNNVLTWRTGRGKSSPTTWTPIAPERGANLVHWSNETSSKLWEEWKKKNVLGGKNVSLNDVLIEAVKKVPIDGWFIEEVEPADWRSDGYKALLQKSGLPDFGKAVRRIRSEKLEPNDRNMAIQAEETLLAGKLTGMDVEEILLIWVTELKAAEEDEQWRDSHINRAFRAILWDGNPILKALGIEMSSSCEYLLKEGKLQEVFEDAIGRYAAGQFDNLFAAVVSWPKWDTEHEQVTGTNPQDCVFCRNLLEAKAIQFTRDKKEATEEGYRDTVAFLCRSLNPMLKSIDRVDAPDRDDYGMWFEEPDRGYDPWSE